MRKKWLLILSLLVVLAAVSAFVSAPRAVADNSVNAKLFCLTFCWDGSPCGTTDIGFFNGGDFQTADGGAGTYTWAPPNLDIFFTVGCLPHYDGVKSGPQVTGTMMCQDGSGSAGTWSMASPGGCAPPSANSGISASGLWK